MKKLTVCFLIALVTSVFCQVFAFGGGPDIYVNQQKINTAAFIQDGTTYVPIRAVAESLGASVEWNAGDGSVLISSHSGADFSKIIERLSPSVVGIIGNLTSEASAAYQDRFSEGIALGTGVVIKSGGEILTNAHVVKDMYNIVVILYDGSGYQARIKYIDEVSDLAVIKIDKIGLTVAPLAEPDQITVGENVSALGTPLTMSLRNSATHGIVSAINRAVGSSYNLIQTDAAINSGNSGGPLINMRGEVIGINSSGFVGIGIEGICFAIPMSTVKYVLNHFDTYGRVRRPDIAAELEEDWVAAYGLPTQNGLTVKRVTEGGSAHVAGIVAGDIISAVNDTQIRSLVDWNETMKAYLPGQEVQLTIYRDGAFTNIPVLLGE